MPNTESKNSKTPIWSSRTRIRDPRKVTTYALLACGGKASFDALYGIIGHHPRFRRLCELCMDEIRDVLESHGQLFKKQGGAWVYVGTVTRAERRSIKALRLRLIEAGTLPER